MIVPSYRESGNEILVEKGLNALSHCLCADTEYIMQWKSFTVSNWKEKPKCEYTRYTHIKSFGIH